jgi:flagellar motor switch protein FliN
MDQENLNSKPADPSQPEAAAPAEPAAEQAAAAEPEPGREPEQSEPEAAPDVEPPTQAEAFIRSLAPELGGGDLQPAPAEPADAESAVRQGAENQNVEEVQRVKYSPLQAGTVEAPLHNIDYLKDINLEAGVELGNTTMSVEQILGLGVGSIVELNQTVGDPVRLLISNHVYAQGEVVVIGDKFGIRISRVTQA